jgi:hypothetical protein
MDDGLFVGSGCVTHAVEHFSLFLFIKLACWGKAQERKSALFPAS